MSQKKPNLIYMFADQLRLCSMGYYGDKKAITPNIDALSHDSCNLTNAVSGHPVCAPYRASLFTGKYTTSTGMVINEIRLNPNHRSFADVLDDEGYNTAYIGKWHMYANQLGHHADPKNSYIPEGRDRLGFNGLFAAYNFHHENYGETSYYHLNSPEKIHYDGFEPDCQTDMAIEEMKRLAGEDKPFALFLSIGIPHDPWDEWNCDPKAYKMFENTEFTLPENYLPDNDPYADDWAKLSPEDRKNLPYWMKGYYSMAEKADEEVGRMLAAIKEAGLEDDTIFVFTSDHGELFGAHGRRAKNIFYEEAVRVPFLVRYPGKLQNGERDVCMNTVDIMPTLLSMMGMKDDIPEEVEGRDLSEAVYGREGADKPYGALMMGTGATAAWEDGHEWRAYRTDRYTYALYLRDGAELLFDNVEDPLQMHDLSLDPAYFEKKVELRNEMYAEMNRIGDRFHTSTYYRDNWTKDRIILKTKAD